MRTTVILPPLLLVATSCTSIGPRNVERDRFDYNRVIAESNDQQMLLNIVRLHFRDVPSFMEVSSVLTQYTQTGSMGINGATGVLNGFDADSVGASASMRFIERPTITFSPMSGPDFAAQLLTPIPPGLVFTLVNSGWPARDLLHMTIERFNDVRNVPFRGREGADELVVSAEFVEVVDLIVELTTAGAFEMQASEETDDAYLVLVDGVDPGADERLARLRELTGLSPGVSRYRVVTRRLERAPDEVTIRVRSLLALMGVLSRGVRAQEALRIETPSAPADEPTPPVSRLVVHSGTERPDAAFVAVEYRGRWFHIDETDLASREAFGLLNYLFLMMASPPEAKGPLITVPAS